jgi:anti-sigma factor RsiW
MGYSDSNSYQANNTHIDTELLSAYIDGEVTAKEAARVEHHIAVCQGCAEELASLRWTVGLLQQVPAVPVPRSFVVRAADLEPEPGRSGRLLPGWLVNGLQWATVATAILAILIFAFDFLAAGPPAPLPSTAMRALEAQPPVAEGERAPERAEPAAGVAGTPVPEAQALEAPAPAADATAPAIVNQTTAPTLRERLRPVEAVLLAVLIILLIASLWARRWRARTADYRR